MLREHFWENLMGSLWTKSLRDKVAVDAEGCFATEFASAGRITPEHAPVNSLLVAPIPIELTR